MKICLIGYGYWGKIIHKNLMSLGYDDFKIIDIVLDNFHELDDTYDYYFVITPFTSHHDVLSKIGQYKNKRIWCEKPLTLTIKEADDIYSLMNKNSYNI